MSGRGRVGGPHDNDEKGAERLKKKANGFAAQNRHGTFFALKSISFA